MAKELYPLCARCPVAVCETRGRKLSDGPPNFEEAPAFCPVRLMPEVISEAIAEYEKPEVGGFARVALKQVADNYEMVPGGMRSTHLMSSSSALRRMRRGKSG